MQIKKTGEFLLFILLFLMMLSSASALANPFEPVGKLIKDSNADYIFSDQFSQGVLNGNAGDISIARFVIGVILFTILFLIVQAIGKEKTSKRIAFFIALGLTILSVVAIPKAIIVSIFATYSAVASILFFSLPIALIWWLTNYMQQHVQSFRVRHLLTAAAGMIMLSILVSFQTALLRDASSSKYLDFLTQNGWLDLAVVLITIFSLYHLIVGIVGERAGSHSLFGRGSSGSSGPAPTFHTDPSTPTHPGASSPDAAREVSQGLVADATAAAIGNVDLDNNIEPIEQAITGLERMSLDDIHKEENYIHALEQALAQLSEQLEKISLAKEAIAQAQGTPGTEKRIAELQAQVQQGGTLFGQKWNELGAAMQQLQATEQKEAQEFTAIIDDVKKITNALLQKQVSLQKIAQDIEPLVREAHKKKNTGDAQLDKDIVAFTQLANELMRKINEVKAVLNAEQGKAAAVQQEATNEEKKTANIAAVLSSFYTIVQTTARHIQEQKYKEALASLRELLEKTKQLEPIVEQKKAAVEQKGILSTRITELIQLFGTVKQQDQNLAKEVEQLRSLMPEK